MIIVSDLGLRRDVDFISADNLASFAARDIAASLLHYHLAIDPLSLCQIAPKELLFNSSLLAQRSNLSRCTQ